MESEMINWVMNLLLAILITLALLCRWASTSGAWDGTSMDLFWILFGIFASAIVIAMVLGRMHGTLII